MPKRIPISQQDRRTLWYISRRLKAVTGKNISRSKIISTAINLQADAVVELLAARKG